MELGLNIKPADRSEGLEYEIFQIGDRADHLKPVFEHIVVKIMNREKRMFESRGATSGTYWTPLREKTVKEKRRELAPFPERPLWRTGKLMRSLTERGAEGQILQISDDTFRFGTKINYAAFHESGNKNMAARPPLVIPKKHAQEYIDDIERYVFEGEL